MATDDGATGICGDATRVAVLEEVEVSRPARVVIGTNRDDTAVLATLTVRQLNPTATIVAVVRHAENAPLLRTAGRYCRRLRRGSRTAVGRLGTVAGNR